MNPAMVIILALIVVGLPVVAGIGLEAYKRHVRFKEKELELMASNTAEKAAQYAAQIERMEQRMRVLERIATDRGADLAQEIEDLRNKPVN
ncbi:hypothetical protein FHS61_001608 [Altererythrobacter atlanticus]|uniref:Uncharacterized protein n=1 Tax=Croceibacterium atlanticum TaxID=1267766 RepID=A0A0F7KVC2_9SPHN|nr:hypothetical protein [Croceibacterium atlanticum]AKH41084.1 hypothetical protein WYH_00017 [Croceibacterium atlanticum]MBB5732599.1 hypothetical protein [Croceibacterium atlanticum]